MQDEPGSRPIPSLGGPEETSRQLEERQAAPHKRAPLVAWTAPYFDWKKQLMEEHKLSYGLSANLLYQHATETATSSDDAFGGVYRFQGSWHALGHGTGSPGRLDWRVEHRSDGFGLLSPTQLGNGAGAAALNPGFAYSDGFDTDLSVLNWTQGFNDRRIGVAVGRLSFDVYQDSFLFQTFSRAFINRSFVLNPTIAATGIGALGAVAKGYVVDNFWVGGQIYDANAVSGEFDLDTVEEGEWLKNIELGWTPSVERYKTDRVQLTYWEKDAREVAGQPSGQGWVVSASWQVAPKWIPFTRFGHSDGGGGAPAESALSAGFEYAVDDFSAWSLGLGWAEPSAKTHGAELRDEYALETSYRVQLSPAISIMPDLQLLKDPAKAPDVDHVWILGVRAILTL